MTDDNAKFYEALFKQLRVPRYWKPRIEYTKYGKEWRASLSIPDFAYVMAGENNSRSIFCDGYGRSQKKAREALWRSVRKRANQLYEYAIRFDMRRLPCPLNNYMRAKMREESVYRRIMPPMPFSFEPDERFPMTTLPEAFEPLVIPNETTSDH